MLNEIIERSGLTFLKNIEFEEVTPGRFFQKEKIDLGNGYEQFYVILGPNIESPVHNHAADNIEETHMLLFGSGKFMIYGDKEEVLELKKGEFHKIFSDDDSAPDHKYIAGPNGSITLAVERRLAKRARGAYLRKLLAKK